MLNCGNDCRKISDPRGSQQHYLFNTNTFLLIMYSRWRSKTGTKMTIT
jgi:hypothetical protein